MKVVCRYGHFAFFPGDRRDVLHFQRLFKTTLRREDDYFTFPALEGLPRWSQTLRPFGNLPAVVNYEGRKPWDVMKENDFVFSLVTMSLVPRASIVAKATVKQTLDCAIYDRPLLQPGSLIGGAAILVGYHGMVDLKFQKLYIYAQETFT